MKVYYNFF